MGSPVEFEADILSIKPDTKMLKSAVFLDRDGVINSYVYNQEFGFVDSPANPGEFTLFPGVPGAIRQFNDLGFLVIVVSNQPGIAKGKFSNALLVAMTRKMEEAVRAGEGKIDSVYYCLHHPQAELAEYRRECACRKPAPGMLLEAAAEHNIDLGKSYTIGDGTVDILAGRAAGTTTIFIGLRKCYVCDELVRRGVEPNYFADGLPEAAQIVRALENGEQPIAALHCSHPRIGDQK
jgi:D-glycero-D-manno-heptose 1,7-bisphosphate phosphatase